MEKTGHIITEKDISEESKPKDSFSAETVSKQRINQDLPRVGNQKNNHDMLKKEYSCALDTKFPDSDEKKNIMLKSCSGVFLKHFGQLRFFSNCIFY